MKELRNWSVKSSSGAHQKNIFNVNLGFNDGTTSEFIVDGIKNLGGLLNTLHHVLYLKAYEASGSAAIQKRKEM